MWRWEQEWRDQSVDVAGDAESVDSLGVQFQRVHSRVHGLAVGTLVVAGEVRLQMMPPAPDTLQANHTLVHLRTRRIRVKDPVRIVPRDERLNRTSGSVSRPETWNW